MKKILTITLVLVLSVVAVFAAKTAPKSKIAVAVVPYSLEFVHSDINGNTRSKPLASVGFSAETMRNIYKYWALGLDVTEVHYDFDKDGKVCTFDTFALLNSYVTVPLGDWVTYKFGLGAGLNLEMVNSNPVRDDFHLSELQAYVAFGAKTGFDFKFTDTFGATVACSFMTTIQANNSACFFIVPNTGFTVSL